MPEQRMTTRVEEDTFRRLRMESALTGETIQELVQRALVEFLDYRADERREIRSHE
jgi:hypothetical protein